MDNLNQDELIAHLNAQTGQITWQELQPFFAKGALQYLATGYDLIDIATALIRDDKLIILPLVEAKILGPLEDAKAKEIQMNDEFWAVVIAPWVLIQPKS